MYGQRALAHSIQVQRFVQRAFPPADFFFKSILSRKNWQGGGELLLKNGTLDSYAY